jgi:hypothetical protein
MRASEGGSGFSEGDIKRDNLDVSVPIPGRTSLTVDAEDPAIARETRAQVPMSITNEGDGTAGTLEIRASPAQGSELRVPSAGSAIRIDELGPGETQTVPVTVVAPATTGLHDLRVTVTYASTVGEPTVANRTVPTDVAYRSIDPVQVRLGDDQITAGRTNELPFRITNGGETRLRDLEAHLVTTTGEAAATSVSPLNGTGVLALGTLAEGETTQAEVSVYASREAPDLVPVDLRLQWRDDSGLDRSLERTFALVVQGAIQIEMAGLDARLDEVDEEIVVEGRITNTGNTEATNVYLQIEPADGVEGTEPVYQGDLDPDSPIPFTLASPADPDRAPDSLTLRLTWTDDQGSARELTQGVGVRPAAQPSQPAEPAEDNGIPGLGATAVLLVVLAAARLRREA